MNRNRRISIATGVGLASLCMTLAGCGVGGSTDTSTPTGLPGVALHGTVYGGQQPIIGASIYLYAAGNTGYGSAYTYTTGNSLLGNHSVTTGTGGSFSITGDYTCPAANPEVYMEAVGGVPVAGQAANPNIIMMAALGPCNNLKSSTFIFMDELTTVASAWALAPFMTGPANIGTSGGANGNTVGLTNAFSSVNTLVNIATGLTNTTTLPAGATIPTSELNTLADILAACINTPGGGVANDGQTACGTLFGNTIPPGGSAPTDTLTAAMNMAHYPSQNVTTLASLAGKTPPFEPIETSVPSDWTIAIRYTANATLNTPIGVAADQSGDIWITNVGTVTSTGPTGPYSLTKISPTGTFVSTTTGVGNANFGAVAIDQNGYAWVQGSKSSQRLAKVSPTGTVTTFGNIGGLLNGGSYSIAVDGTSGGGNVWAGQTAVVSEISNTGTAVSTTGYSGGGVSTALSVAITTH